jgi:hypothetical protein
MEVAWSSNFLCPLIYSSHSHFLPLSSLPGTLAPSPPF